MELKERTKSILLCGIRHFIETGEPITSKDLFEKYDFGIRPAMIRAELNLLGDEGYFTQNHPSGGRTPTAKGYRFFVDYLLNDLSVVSANPRMAVYAGELAAELRRGETKSFIEELSRHLELFGVGYGAREERMYESGIYDLFCRIDTGEKSDFLDIARDLEFIESRIDDTDRWWLAEETWPQVFIGESPVTKSKQLSVIANRFDVAGNPFLLLMIGPIRMDYEKSFKFLQAVNQSIQKRNEYGTRK